MLLTGFGMAGVVRWVDSADVDGRLRRGTVRPVWPPEPGRTAVRYQGPLSETERPVSTARADRVQLTGWIDLGSHLVQKEDRLPGAGVSALQRLLDAQGSAAVRALRGDFVLAHLSPDRRTLRLYRAVSALIPLFWRIDDECFAWAADPVQLLDDGRPRLRDVDTDLLPMIIAERGFPHDRSWFAGVQRLPTGECLTLRAGSRPERTTFDELRPTPDPPASLAGAAEGVRARMSRACDKMLADQSAFVVMLSGGTDSAAVAWEAGRQAGRGTAIHYTLDSFPGFEADRRAAEEIAHACGLSWVPYEMSKHARRDGDYLRVNDDGGLPQTHVPSHGVTAAVEQAEVDGATFVLSGLLSDQVFAHDVNRGLFEVAGWRMLDPRVAGEPIWQSLTEAAAGTFSTSSHGGWLRYLYRLLTADPTTALPSRDVIVHSLGFTEAAGRRVTQALHDAACRVEQGLRAVMSGNGLSPRTLPRGVTSRFLLAEGFNTPNLQAAWLSHCLPKRRFFATPYADRDLIEYALALPTAHRVGFGHGMTIDKFSFRLAYADCGLPAHTSIRMQQARIDAISAVFANQNFATCRELLDGDSVLRRLGVLGPEFVARLSPGRIHRNGEEVARLCIVEKWLRGLA